MFDLARFLPYHINRTGVRLADAFGDELARYGLTITMWRAAGARWEGCRRPARPATI